MTNKHYYIIIIAFICLISSFKLTNSYSAIEDAKIIKKFLESMNKPNPPKDHAKVARTLVHKSFWAATGTISTIEKLSGFPMVNIISISDSAKDAPSTGNIYFMLTMLDFTGQDIKVKNKITLLISNDEDLSCTRNNHTDPMEPTCARVILSGKVVELNRSTKEYKFGHDAFISRHPAAENWIKAHTFFLCKLDIENIFVLDWYGGPHDVSVADYYKAILDVDFDYFGIMNEVSTKTTDAIVLQQNFTQKRRMKLLK